MYNVETSVETKSKQSDAAGSLTIPPNPHRCGILLGSPVGRTTLIAMGANGTAGQGVPLPSAAPPLLITEGMVGKAIQAAITLTDSAGAQQIFTWTEYVRAL